LRTIADQVFQGARWLAIGRVTTPLLTFLASLVTIRLLEPADIGLFALVSAIAGFFVLFEDFGLRARVIQVDEIGKPELARIFGLSLLLNLALALMLVAVSPLVAALYAEPRLTVLLIAMAGVLLVSAVGTIADAVLKRRLRFGTLALIDIVQGTVTAGSGLILAWQGFGVWSLVGATAVGTVLRTLAVSLLSPVRVRPDMRFGGTKNALAFGGFITGQRLLFWLYTRSDRLALGHVGGANALGIYAVGADVANMPADRIGGLIGLTTFAGLSRVAHDPEIFRRYYLDGVRLIALVLFPVGCGLSVLLPDLLPLLLGPQWEAAIPIAQVLAVIVPLRLINGTVAEGLNAMGRPREALICVATVATLVVGGSLIGLAGGPLGVAVGWASAFSLGFLVNALVNLKRIGVPPRAFFAALAPAALGAIIMTLFVHQARELIVSNLSPSVISLVCLQALLGAAFYALAILLFDRRGVRLLLDLAGFRHRR